MITRLIARLRSLALRRRIAGEIDEELHDHVERETAANIARGLAPAEARRVALAELGGLTQTRESIHSERASRLAAVRHALSIRHLRRQPLYVVSCVVTLMLAVAAATTMGAAIKPALLDPLPYRDDGALVMLSNSNPTGGLGWVNIHTLNDLRAGTPPLAAVTASRGASASFTTADGVFPIFSTLVEPNYFSTLGVTPAAGRLWAEHETNVVLLAWGFWQRSLNASPDAIGRSITIDGIDRTVVGIMPRGFVPPWNAMADVLLPLDPAQLLADPYRARRQLMVIGRRADGASLEEVRAYLGVFSTRINAEHTNVPGGQTVVAHPLRERLLGSSRPVLLGTAAATILLLLIVTANIAGLAAVRGIAQRRQTAVKIALGAGRWRILGERIGESALIATAASIAGVAVSALLIATLRRYQGTVPGNARAD